MYWKLKPLIYVRVRSGYTTDNIELNYTVDFVNIKFVSQTKKIRHLQSGVRSASCS